MNTVNNLCIAIGILSIFLLICCVSTNGNLTNEATVQENVEDTIPEVVIDPTHFTVQIRNVSESSFLTTPLSPGLFIVHEGVSPLFTNGEVDKGLGLEDLAEDGNPAVLAENIASATMSNGVFYTPTGEEAAGPLFPGTSAYEFSFTALPGNKLSLALMLVQSNDLFFATQDTGIELFPQGEALSGDITSRIQIWDAGTEINEEPGSGSNQLPRQRGPNTGPRENGVVSEVNDGFNYPSVNELIQVRIEHRQ